MVAEAASKLQQSGIGISLLRVAGGGSGKSIDGCSFFISLAPFAGGSGRVVIRAVSFLRESILIGAGMVAAAARSGEGGSAGPVGFERGRVGN